MHFLHFKHRKAQNIVKDYRDLKNKIEELGFPPGRMTGPRTWTDQELEEWHQSLPTALEARPAAKVKMSDEAKREFDARRARKAAEAKRAREAMNGEAV
jgi:hypothetical protein